MFDIAPTELMVVAAVALLVIPPKDFPRAMRKVGSWVGQARGMARHFRSGIDEMIRQSELEDMEKKWAEENARILREHPATSGITGETMGLAAPESAIGDGTAVMRPLDVSSVEGSTEHAPAGLPSFLPAPDTAAEPPPDEPTLPFAAPPEGRSAP